MDDDKSNSTISYHLPSYLDLTLALLRLFTSVRESFLLHIKSGCHKLPLSPA